MLKLILFTLIAIPHSLLKPYSFSPIIPNGNSFRFGSDYNDACLHTKIYIKNTLKKKI